MNKRTVKDLRALAKDRGLKGYYRLNKADLVNMLQPRHIMDEPVPDIGRAPLIPRSVSRSVTNAVKSLKNMAGIAADKVKKGFSDLANWIMDYVPIPKAVDPVIESIKSLYSLRVREKERSVRGWFKTFYIPGLPNNDVETFMRNVKSSVLKLYKRDEFRRGVKTKLILNVEMERTDITTGEVFFAMPYFQSNNHIILENTNTSEIYEEMVQQIIEAMANFNRKGSDWTLRSIIGLDILMDKYRPLGGSSYIPLPSKLAKKKAIVNPRNADDECFKWAVTIALDPADVHPERITQTVKANSERFNWEGVNFPAKREDVVAFERANPDVAVNLFSWDDETHTTYPTYYSTKEELINNLELKNSLKRLREKVKDSEQDIKRFLEEEQWLIREAEKKLEKAEESRELKRVINLMLICDGENQHYCWIKNMSRLVSSQHSEHKEAVHICYNCMTVYWSEESLESHQRWCLENDHVALRFPSLEDKIKFRNYNRSMRVPFVIYADFESFNRPLATTDPPTEGSYTHKKSIHQPSGFCFQIVSPVGKFEPVLYTVKDDEDVAQVFVEKIEEEVYNLYNNPKYRKKPMKITRKVQERFEVATHCHICEEELNGDKVRDHCHLTGYYRGAAHNECNLKYTLPKFYPIYFHNLSGYDAHLFVKNLGATDGELSCIPNNEEKYISFSKRILVGTFMGVDKNGDPKEVKVYRDWRFLDSYKFMASSLDKLTANLRDEDRKTLMKRFSGEKLKLVSRKGVFPYEWFDGPSKLEETRLPPKEAFWSELNLTGVSDEDYRHAQNVWEKFDMKTFREYHDLYLETDVLHLADIFERFRDVCVKEYGLDPAWYFTAPGLSWDAMLKTTKAEFDPITNTEMLLFFERQIRGGVSMITTRHAEANNK